MKAKSTLKLLLTLVIVAILVVVTFTGFGFGNYKMMPIANSIKLGLDINGGSYLEYQAVKGDANITNISEDEVNTTIAVLRSRADARNYNEALITYMNNGRFRIELPSVKDVNEASRVFGTVAKLTFNAVNADGTAGEVLVDGKDVKNAVYKFDAVEENGALQHYVSLELNSKGAKAFEEATGARVGQQIAICLDGVVKSAPMVNERISGGQAVITVGNHDKAEQEAREMADLIRSGHLPFSIKEVGSSSVSATLGQNAFSNALLAGIISIIIIALFMIILYRLPGLVATLALCIYTVITIFVLGIAEVNLTLPGIAGVVLSLGMAVDANVIIFERIKEEMKNGKTLRASIDAGFDRAVTAIIDSNVTTIISAVVLWVLGSGTVQGFAKTLFIGVIVSMFTAIFVTKFLLKIITDFNIKNRKLFVGGVK